MYLSRQAMSGEADFGNAGDRAAAAPAQEVPQGTQAFVN